MGVEGASAGIEAGVSMGTSMGAESAASVGSAVGPASMSMPEFGYGSMSSIKSPEFSPLSSAIVTEISKPAGLDDLDSLPEPIMGDFNLRDIAREPFANSTDEVVSSIYIEPATYLDPITVSQIDTEIEAEARSAAKDAETGQIAHNEKPITQIEIPQSEAVEPYNVFDHQPIGTHTLAKPMDTPGVDLSLNQENTPGVSQAEATREVTTLATGILTLGAIDISEAETKADKQAAQDALALLESFEFDSETATMWQEKLQSVTQPQAQTEPEAQVQTAPETQTETEVETETETSVQTAALSGVGSEPPQNQKNKNGEDEREEEKPVQKKKETSWRIDFIGDRWEEAKETNRQRNRLASDIASDIVSTGVDSKSAAEATAAQLDLPAGVDDAIKETEGRLKIPAIAPRISIALSALDANDPETIAEVVLETVRKNPAKEMVNYVQDSKIVPVANMDADAQLLIAQGAEALVYQEKSKKLGKWKQVSYLPRKNPLEAEEQTNVA